MAGILIVDDSHAFRKMVRSILEEVGHQVDEASNGREAEERMKENLAELVLMDMLMPEQEGVATTLALRRDYPGIKIVAMSGGGRVRDMRFLDLAKEFGAEAALEKPFRADALKRTVAELLDKPA